MTQEYVAEALNVSRQAVSKWEPGAAEPSPSNLLALAKLYGVDPGDLLKGVQ
jgi:transcriptional regulator with XRE-family HTH domain